MSENTTAKTNVIPFRKAELLLIEKDGEAFVPMKPIVEGMGLAWQVQHRKLQDGRFESCITEMVIQMQGDDQRRTMTCLPLRKLAGWLMSIHPGKIKNEDVKQRVIDYQNECDDVLWAYWSEKLKAQHPAIQAGLTPLQQRHIQQQVAVLANQPGNSYQSVYRSIKDKFMVGTYKDVPAEKYGDLCRFIGCEPIEGEYMGRENTFADLIGHPLGSSRWLVSLDCDGIERFTKIPNDACVMNHGDLIKATVTPGELRVDTDQMFEFLIAGLVNLRRRTQAQSWSLQELRRRH